MSSALNTFRLPLHSLALAPATRIAYNRAIEFFLQHARLSPRRFMRLPADQADRLLAHFIQHSHDIGSPFAYASHALHAVAFYRPDLKLHLHISRICIRGWERSRHTKSHPPLTWDMTVLLACTLAKSGHVSQAIGMLLAFDCYLRVSELTSIQKSHIVMPNDARLGSVDTNMAVILPRTKTGPNQSVTIRRECVKHVIGAWMRSTVLRSAKPSALVFDFTPASLRYLMRVACASLNLPTYVPHSLRHGGATHDFVNESIEHVQFRGRWKSLESSRRYIQSGRALLASQSISNELQDLAQTLTQNLVPLMLRFIDKNRSRKCVSFDL